MAVKKSVTLDEDVVDGIAAEVGERGFSAWLNEAARARLDREHVLRFLDEQDAEHGPVAPGLLEAARQAWTGLVAPNSERVTDLLAALEASVEEARRQERSAAKAPRDRAAG